MVKSSITGRKMCKMVIPIEETVIDIILNTKLSVEENVADKIGLGNNTVLKRGKKMAEMEIAKKKVFYSIPSSVLRFYRSKNQNEYILDSLKQYECYLETNEDAELVEYFYLETCKLKKDSTALKQDKKADDDKITDNITKLNSNFERLAYKNIQKKQLLMTLED
jgi:hypothetical protein